VRSKPSGGVDYDDQQRGADRHGHRQPEQQHHIELDATHLGELDPDTATPDQDSDRVRYRIGWVCWCTSAPTPNTPAGTNLSAARQ